MNLFNKKDGLQNVHDNITRTFIKVGQWVQNKKFRLRLMRAIYTRSTSMLSAQVTITELCFLPIFGR